MDRTSEPQTKTGDDLRKYLISALILGVGAAALTILFMMKPVADDKESTLLIPLVTLYEVQPFTGQLDMEVSGTVVPFREISVAAEVQGNILKKHPECQAGNYVKKGTVLLEIDPQEYLLNQVTINLEVAQAQKTIEETEEEIRGAQRNLKLAEDDYKLQEQDFERNQRLGSVLSKSEFDQAKRALLNAQSQLTARKNTLAQLRARKPRLDATLNLTKSRAGKAQLDFDRTKIVAPSDGVIVQERVQQDDHVLPGNILVIFEDTSHAEVICNLTQEDIKWVRDYAADDRAVNPDRELMNQVYHIPKTDVAIFDKSHPDRVWSGTLERFDGIGRNEMTKTIPVRIVVENPIIQTPDGPEALVRGMFVKCRVQVNTSDSAIDRELLSFPELALRPGNHIWVVRDMKLKRIEVTVVDRIKSTFDGEQKPFVVVLQNENGLQSNDQLVVSPISQPTNGAVVQVESVTSEEETNTESDDGKTVEDKAEIDSTPNKQS